MDGPGSARSGECHYEPLSISPHIPLDKHEAIDDHGCGRPDSAMTCVEPVLSPNIHRIGLSTPGQPTITMSDPLLQIPNHHTAACGDPPIVDGTDDCYVGYFENPYGEQWIFTLDRTTGKATLRGGDVGWNTKFDVLDGTVADLILGPEERLWLQACWSAAQKQAVRS